MTNGANDIGGLSDSLDARLTSHQLSAAGQLAGRTVSDSTNFDAIVIGAGIAGLTTTQILSQNGYRVLLLEKERRLGGTNSSFQNQRGDYFDYGYHTLDFGRSPFVTRYFARMLKGRFHSFPLRRAIAVRRHVVPYNAPIEDWPDDIARQVGKSEFYDDLASPVTRGALGKIYGDYLTSLAFDEILPSYPTLAWQRRNGRPESELMDQIYPWFFPRSAPKPVAGSEWNRFHQTARNQREHLVMYPSEGGFGAFIDGIIDHIDSSFATIVQGFSRIDIALDHSEQSISGVEVDGMRYTADAYFWCAPIAIIASLLGMPFPASHPQRLCLGSYAFKEGFASQFHEILVGEKDIPINRISFPGKISGKTNNLVQVEYAYPMGELDIEQERWREDCLNYLEAMGLVPKDAQLYEYQFFGANKGFVSVHDPLKSLLEFRARLRDNTNIVYPYIGLEVDNISRIVPSVFREVYRAITAGPIGAAAQHS